MAVALVPLPRLPLERLVCEDSPRHAASSRKAAVDGSRQQKHLEHDCPTKHHTGARRQEARDRESGLALQSDWENHELGSPRMGDVELQEKKKHREELLHRQERAEQRERIRAAAQEAERLRNKADEIRHTMVVLEQDRLIVIKSLSALSREHLAEVRQLARNPPNAVRRTLVALWLLLHADRFGDRRRIYFDEVKHWPLLQKMLGDEDFLGRLLSLDASYLASIPRVVAHISEMYLGLEGAPTVQQQQQQQHQHQREQQQQQQQHHHDHHHHHQQQQQQQQSALLPQHIKNMPGNGMLCKQAVCSESSNSSNSSSNNNNINNTSSNNNTNSNNNNNNNKSSEDPACGLSTASTEAMSVSLSLASTYYDSIGSSSDSSDGSDPKRLGVLQPVSMGQQQQQQPRVRGSPAAEVADRAREREGETEGGRGKYYEHHHRHRKADARQTCKEHVPVKAPNAKSDKGSNGPISFTSGPTDMTPVPGRLKLANLPSPNALRSPRIELLFSRPAVSSSRPHAKWPSIPSFSARGARSGVDSSAGGGSGSSGPLSARSSTSLLDRSRALSSASPRPTPLTVASVSRASDAMGRLLKWLLSLLRETSERERLTVELSQIEEQLTVLLPQARIPICETPAPRTPTPTQEPFQTPAPMLLGVRGGSPAPGLVKPVSLPTVEKSGRKTPEKAAPKRPSSRLRYNGRRSPAAEVELHVTGSLPSLQQTLKEISILFPPNASEFCVELADSRRSLSALLRLLKDQRPRLKIRCVGFRLSSELSHLALMRAQSVATAVGEALTEDPRFHHEGLLPRALVRAESYPDGHTSCAAGGGCGAKVTVEALTELVPVYGPLPRELAANSAQVGLYFASKSVELTCETSTILREVARFLKANAPRPVTIEGHSDRSEASDLGSARARVVLKELTRLGVPERLLKSIGRGSNCPLSRHSAVNRRVEIFLEQ